MIPDLMLERFALGELPQNERARVEQALRQDPALREKLESLRLDSQATLARYTPRAVNAEVQHRARQTIARPTKRWVPTAAAAMAAVVIAALAFVARSTGEDDIRLKGDGPQLRLFVQAPEGAQRLKDGAKVYPHDVVQVELDAAGQPFAVVVSVDGAGQATLHAAYDAAALKARGGTKRVENAFELDGSPGFERFFLVTDAAPLEPGRVLQAAQALAKHSDANKAPLLVSSTATVRSVLLEKVTP